MPKILLIGRNGQLGKALLKAAHDFDFEVIAVDKDEIDVSRSESIVRIMNEIQPNILINTSAYHVVPRCEDYPMEAMKINFEAVAAMAKISKDAAIKFITFSTDYVFSGEGRSPFKESDSPNPLQMYGLSKLAGERAALNIYPEGSFIIRTASLFGGGEKGSPEKGGNFVLNILKEADGNSSIEVDSAQTMSPTFAGDLGRAILQLFSLSVAPGIYHLVNEGSSSWADFTKAIFKIAGLSTNVISVDRGGRNGKMQRPLFSVLANTKAHALGVVLPPWQDGLKRYMAEIGYK